MGVSVGSSFRITVAVLMVSFVLAVALVAGIAGKVGARADINDYLSKGPNDFYPSGHDREGPMKLAIDTVGWNATRLAGNLGIGNGSVKTFDRTSTFEVEYPDNGFMCGDVSAQPWVPGMKTAPTEVEEAAVDNATGDVGGNRTGEDAFNESGRLATNNTVTNITATNNTAPVKREQAKATGENLTFAAYHPIQYLRPVKDVLYEHPLATSGTSYCELLGFETPTGDLVNVGMKCTGYGY